MQQIRPMSFGEILDGAFKIYRSHFMPLFLSALISYAPFVVLGAVLGVVLGTGTEESTAAVAAMGLTMFITFPFMVLGFAMSWGSVTHLASEAYLGHPVTLGAGLSRGLKRALPLLGALLMASFLMVLGFLVFIIPGLIVMAMFFAVFPAVVVENRGPVEALGRSRELARGSLGRILGILFVAGVIAALAVACGGASEQVEAPEPETVMVTVEKTVETLLARRPASTPRRSASAAPTAFTPNRPPSACAWPVARISPVSASTTLRASMRPMT